MSSATPSGRSHGDCRQLRPALEAEEPDVEVLGNQGGKALIENVAANQTNAIVKAQHLDVGGGLPANARVSNPTSQEETRIEPSHVAGLAQ